MSLLYRCNQTDNLQPYRDRETARVKTAGSGNKPIFQIKYLFYLATMLFVLEGLLILSVSIPWMLEKINADDFYYYLVLARNNAAGLGPTFDGTELTNGFHPLFLLLLTPVARLLDGNSELLIRAGLLILLLFHNGTGFIIGLGFYRLGRPDIGWLMALGWLFNPWTLAITLHGVEVPIAAFFWAISIFGLLEVRRGQTAMSMRRAIGLGLVVGLAVLARTDGLLLLGAILATELLRAWYMSSHRRQIIFTTFVIAVTALILTLPWWWWNLANFAMVMQVSGKAIFLYTHGFDWLKPNFIIAKTAFAAYLYSSRLIVYLALPLIILGFTLWKRRFASIKPTAPVFKPLLQQLDFALLAVLALAGWYIFWHWLIQNWYLLTTILTVTIILGFVLEKRLATQTPADIGQTAGIVIMVSTLFLIGTYLNNGFGYPLQKRGYYLAQWLNQHTEPEAIIGAWNSGIIGYFSERPVVNLDGVVNNSLYHYRVAHQASSVSGIMGYIQQRGINYVTDYEPLILLEPQKMGLNERYQSPEYGFTVYQRVITP